MRFKSPKPLFFTLKDSKSITDELNLEKFPYFYHSDLFLN